jgi:hypothetical protein
MGYSGTILFPGHHTGITFGITVEKQHKGSWQKNSQNSDTTAPSGRELYHLQYSLQAASTETFVYTLVNFMTIKILARSESSVFS